MHRLLLSTPKHDINDPCTTMEVRSTFHIWSKSRKDISDLPRSLQPNLSIHTCNNLATEP